MFFKQIDCGGYNNFGYIIADEEEKKCVLIDPSPDIEAIITEVNRNKFDIAYLINTHDHPDHTAGNQKIQDKSKAKLVLHSSSSKAEIKVNHGDNLSCGKLNFEILHTPGHTEDSICIFVNNHLITGDTLFVGKVGGTNSRKNALKEFNSLKQLMELNDAVSVWPGHDYGLKNTSTIKEERENNPFCQRLHDFEEFFNLKENWDNYKKAHGIT